MRTLIALAVLTAFGFALGLNGAAMAQKKHAPKLVWQAMVASLNDIQSITGALAVFDMERATTIADGLVNRETFISKMEQLPEPVRKGHGKGAEAATELAAATRSGDEQEISMKIGAVLAACSSCHYEVRDAERRKKLE